MKKIISAALLTLAVGGAQAQAYVGGAIGLSKLDFDCPSYFACDDTDVGYKAYVGYADPTSKHFALEAGIIDFGGASARAAALARIDAKAEAFYMAVAVRWNFTGNFGGNARLGVANVKTTCSGQGFGLAASESETDSRVLVGLGLDYAFTKNWKAVASVDGSKADCDGYSGNVTLMSVGAQYSF